MKNEKVTITEIANSLGISPVSISRALSGQPGVSEELKDKIFEKAKEMGYVKPRKNAQSTILVLHQRPYLPDNSNFSHMVQGVEKALQNAGLDYHVEFVDKDVQDKLILPHKLSKGTHFDGVIFIGRFNLDYASFISRKISNVIFLTGYSPSYDYDSVWFSFTNAGYKQSEHLIRQGHRKIGFAGNSQLFRNKERLLGIAAAHNDYQIPLYQDFILDIDESYQAKLEQLIADANLPTAFICDYDFTAIELIKFLYQKNIKVPDDVSIIGGGNTEMSLLSIPALTTLDLNIGYACDIVVATLLKRIGRPDKPSENIAILSKLIVRDSVKGI